MSNIDVAAEVLSINQYLMSQGFYPQDADTSDFRCGGATSLRFKTGTSYGEVTVTVWHHQTQVDVMRCTNVIRIDEAKYKIGELIDAFYVGLQV